jgi:23S rRNA (pseudouridine1915-N3)-methyltransferase
MRIHLLAVGKRLPKWAETAASEYAGRMPRAHELRITAVAPARRHKNQTPGQARAEEARRLLTGVPAGARVVALDERGRMLTSRDIARRLQDWLAGGRDVALLLGGPDGLGNECLRRADFTWSLSRLTLPHALARVVVAEQLYRAGSILAGHPYHR